MGEWRIEHIAAQAEATQDVLLELNNAHSRETSLLTTEDWRELVDIAFFAACADGGAGFLVAVDQDASHASANFRWFHERLRRFVYIDRFVVSGAHQGRGLARSLYTRLFSAARAAGHNRIVCEVNQIPPNPGSDAFHARMGFVERGTATLDHNGKTVRYLEKHLD